MKLKLQNIYAQRDSRWGSVTLGNNAPGSAYTIGLYGCTITSLGMYVNKTPLEVNSLLTPNGFAAGSGELIWSKTSLIGLNQQVLSYRWSSLVTDAGVQQARDLLDQGYPLLCEIDFNPATQGEEMHFVLCIGYDANEVFYIADPWSGQVTSFDVYGGFRRAVIQFRAYDIKLPLDNGAIPDLQTQLDQVRQERDTNWGYFSGLCDVMKVAAVYETAKAELIKLVGIEDTYNQTSKQLADAQGQITDLKLQLAALSDSHNALQSQYNDLQGQLVKDTATIQDLTTKLTDLEKAINAPVRKGWKAFLVSLVDKL